MNKTLMLVICDFLLLSMLALARFDPPEEKPEVGLDVTAASATAEAELISLLEESLQSELNSRQNLTEDLTETRESLQEKARLLAEREAALAATQSNLDATTAKAQELEQTKAEIEAAQAALSAEKARLEAERSELAQRFDSTRTQLEAAKTEQVSLVSTLGQLKEESSVAKEKLSKTEEELIAREIMLAEREAALKAAEEEKATLAAEREKLNRQLEVAQAERRLLEQNLTAEQAEKLQLQREKEQAFARADRLTENVSQLGAGMSQLGQGVSTLTQASEAIKKEIEAARPQTMSEIFTRFQNNRANLRFTATEAGLFGAENVRTYESKSILITDSNGANYLVTHSANSPFAFNKNANNLLAASLEVTLGNRRFPVSQIGFLSTDPRILFIPLPQSLVDNSGLETFPLALQPERWEEAVLVKNDESNFGRTGFRRLTESERFLKMDRPALGQLFADFASTRGDLAFTKNSQFIGILTDSEHAVVIDDFLASGITQLGNQFNTSQNAATMERLRDRVQQLPEKIR
ncbi:hypothetical protein QEH59_01980 [Coraliomargarita sp. SDUM461004]|uniref:Chromosome partition protein Smc n=1 Tax=Thalassobacterium sedimentorum TaxID=3041258 RepID=A0ABU1AEV7_9BACT|nr:hypothetical protein [Coraliomargarita sp. SDUM461004]MDQ8193177.1 hypothetical protein [Coraliomargarita sp. SDUM461004]